MVIQSEQLLESLLDLERSRQREREIRVESEALLKGLRGITGAQDRTELFLSLVDALRKVIDFENAFLLDAAQEGRMTILASTLEELINTIWIPGSVFKRVLAGRPIASFDIALVPEWKSQPDSVKNKITSALHIGLHGGNWNAILVITHKAAKHFGPNHVKKAKRFSPLASQALLTLELRQAVIQRDRFFQLSMDVMAIFDHEGVIKQFNDGWSAILGYERAEVRDRGLLDFVLPEDLASVQKVIGSLEKSGGKQFAEARFKDKQGDYLWLSCSLASYHDEQLFYLVARDITKRVMFEQQLAYDAGHDSLTGLKNRAEFMNALQLAFAKLENYKGYSFALFFLDLNKFKIINDTLGHDVGDELLQLFASMLQKVVRDEDTVCRLGGDEFTIIVNNVKSLDDVNKVVSRIHDQCTEPVLIKGHQVKVSTSIGVAVSSTGYHDEEAMLQAADQAMYNAKADKKVPCVITQ